MLYEGRKGFWGVERGQEARGMRDGMFMIKGMCMSQGGSEGIRVGRGGGRKTTATTLYLRRPSSAFVEALFFSSPSSSSVSTGGW